MTTVEIYTDGACSGNPGPGGWGAILRMGAYEKEFSGNEKQTTNNRMELMAVIEALRALKKAPLDLKIHTDSQYVMKGATEWIEGWKARGWRTAAKKPVENQDLWEQLDELLAKHNVEWEWVRGHSGHPENERADKLAVAARDALK